ncbi:MAG: hypothetical protein WCI73_19080, partial [Phycisphaerae bacterium]
MTMAHILDSSWEVSLRSLLRGIYYAASIDKGLQYAHAGRVRGATQVSPSRENTLYLDGLVQGTHWEPYRVQVHVRRHKERRTTISNQCSCPVSHNCKHGVALLAQAVLEHPDVAAFLLGIGGRAATTLSGVSSPNHVHEPDSPAGRAQTNHLPLLPRAVSLWLGGVGGAVRQEVAPEAAGAGEYRPPVTRAPNDKELLYLLRVEKTVQRVVLALELRRGLRRADGTWSKTSSFTPQIRGLSLGTMAWGRPEDQEIVRLLLGEFGQFYAHIARLSGSFGARILDLVLATGRCYWDLPTGSVLQAGPPRTGELTWLDAGRGRQDAGVAVVPPATAVLPLTPLYYVDAPAGLIGQLQTPHAPELVRAWMTSPIVEPEQVEQVNAAVAVMGAGGVGLPRLHEVTVEVREGLEPRGVLRLVAHKVTPPTYLKRWGAPAPAVALATAQASFIYDQQRIAAACTDAYLEEFREG